jgi:hypothetical protein
MAGNNRWQAPLRKPKRRDDRRYDAPRKVRPHVLRL